MAKTGPPRWAQVLQSVSVDYVDASELRPEPTDFSRHDWPS